MFIFHLTHKASVIWNWLVFQFSRCPIECFCGEVVSTSKDIIPESGHVEGGEREGHRGGQLGSEPKLNLEFLIRSVKDRIRNRIRPSRKTGSDTNTLIKMLQKGAIFPTK